MSEISYDDFLLKIQTAIVKRTSFSFMRFGDGEGIILGYPKLTKPFEMAKRLDKWFGAQTMTERQKLQFADDMRTAATEADVLGIPGKRHGNINKFWDRVTPCLLDCGALSPAKDHICMDVVIEMQERHGWTKILEGLPEVHVISCRLLGARMQAAFHIHTVNEFHIPPQNKPRVGNNYSPGPHFPDRYRALQEYIPAQCTPGSVWLVGAGGLGKVYCSWIKRRGGIALDAGSILDGWAGYTTRSYLRGKLYAL